MNFLAIPAPFRSMIRWAFLLLAAVAGGLGYRHFSRPAWSPALGTPELLLRTLGERDLEEGGLCLNASAQGWVSRLRPRWPRPDPVRLREMAQAAEEPPIFRRLDREARFRGVVLIGDPSEYRELLKHLRGSGDWRLAYLDHMGLVLRREQGKAWKPGDLELLRGSFVADWEWAVCMGQAGQKMLAMGMREAAGDWTRRAVEGAPENAAVHAARAHYWLACSRWDEARAAALRAVELEGDNLSGLSALVQVHVAGNRFEEAYRCSKRLVELRPEDPALLFHHAKMAHQVHAYGSEIEVLERLVRRAEAEGRPVSGYRIYLGQAYAAKGAAVPAVEELEKALADPGLSSEQRQFARETVDRIRRRAGL
jgi:tetratricopeptide (TPR) repeat protein